MNSIVITYHEQYVIILNFIRFLWAIPTRLTQRKIMSRPTFIESDMRKPLRA